MFGELFAQITAVFALNTGVFDSIQTNFGRLIGIVGKNIHINDSMIICVANISFFDERKHLYLQKIQ